MRMYNWRPFTMFPPLFLQSPSAYCSYRKRALRYAMDFIRNSTESKSEPIYIYGDFNFRLDFTAVVKVLLGTDN